MTSPLAAQYIKHPLVCALIHAFSKATAAGNSRARDLRSDALREVATLHDNEREDLLREVNDHLDGIEKSIREARATS